MKRNKNIRTVLAFAVTGISPSACFFHSGQHGQPVRDLRPAAEGAVRGV